MIVFKMDLFSCFCIVSFGNTNDTDFTDKTLIFKFFIRKNQSNQCDKLMLLCFN